MSGHRISELLKRNVVLTAEQSLSPLALVECVGPSSEHLHAGVVFRELLVDFTNNSVWKDVGRPSVKAKLGLHKFIKHLDFDGVFIVCQVKSLHEVRLFADIEVDDWERLWVKNVAAQKSHLVVYLETTEDAVSLTHDQTHLETTHRMQSCSLLRRDWTQLCELQSEHKQPVDAGATGAACETTDGLLNLSQNAEA